jgi:hypothetical protein
MKTGETKEKEPNGGGANVPMPLPAVELVRAAVRGITDEIPKLKAIVAGLQIDEGLKAFIAVELDELTSNAAELHLHDVEMLDGGFNLHLTIKPVQLGEREKAVFVRGAKK